MHAAGGKTRVLTTRIAWLITPAGLARRRDGRHLHQQGRQGDADAPVGDAAAATVRGMWIGTFHGLCNRFLRAHWKLAGLPQGFQILDTADQLSAVKASSRRLNLDEERCVPKQVTWFIAGARERPAPQDVEVRDERTRAWCGGLPAYETNASARAWSTLPS